MAINVWIDKRVAVPGSKSGNFAILNSWNQGVNGQRSRIDQLLSYGYMIDSSRTQEPNGETYVLIRPLDDRRIESRPEHMPVDWVVGPTDPLCPTDTIFGEILRWQACMRFEEHAYLAVVPNGIPGADGSLVWAQWRAPNQAHYHDPSQSPPVYYVSTSAYDGDPLKGTELRIADDEPGVSTISWQQYQQGISDGTIVAVTAQVRRDIRDRNGL